MVDEPDILDDEDASSTITAEESTALEQRFTELEKRCKSANIDFKLEENEGRESYASIYLQSGKSKRRLVVHNPERAAWLLAIQFEKYKFLSGYEAIYCLEDKTIEVGLRATRLSSRYLLERIQGVTVGGDVSKLPPLVLSPPGSIYERPTIEIGPASDEFGALNQGRGALVTLKLRGARASQHDHLLSELRSYADSVFFQIDTLHGSTFILERQRRLGLIPLSRRKTAVQLTYPSAQYNGEAMSLYWYAKTARDMPLLRFLAFYQSIEFYFPRYSQVEARKRVSTILKHPTFRHHRDDDLDRLISAIHTARNSGFGSERSQLRSVVSECISAEEMREYLTNSTEREEHFSGKSSKGRYHKVPLANKNADLRNDVADRIYDIRCKIVHTKNEHSEDDIPMILPFSEDADYLLNDIDLVEFIAKSVLVSSSEELT